jgi:UV DNA damage endonuclease
MKIGYPCINRSVRCVGDKTFRLKSYSKERLIEVSGNNIACLLKMLYFNLKHNILFFRVSSDLIPFASHPVCRFKWQDYFKESFGKIGSFIKDNNIRISMHPDQFNVLNSQEKSVFKRTARELLYHAQILDLMELDYSAKIQIHVGGVYKDKERSIKRFIDRYSKLDKVIKSRLVIENDDKSYTLSDVIKISKAVNIPVIFDTLHHQVNSSGEPLREALALALKSWKREDGIAMVDYSEQREGQRAGVHAESIRPGNFKEFLRCSQGLDFDIMLEIKDKEKSALKAAALALDDERFIR